MVWFAKFRMKQAVIGRDPVSIAALVGEGVDVNLPLGRSGMTGLHLAAEQDIAESLDMLLAKGARVDAKTKYGWTALHFAAYEGHPGIVAKLLKAGADPNLRTSEGRTAQGWAAARGHGDIAEMLAPYIKKPGATLDLPPVPAPASAAPAEKRPGAPSWARLSESQIAHIELHAEVGYKLTDIFNFRSRERIRIVNNLQTKADQMTSLSFDEIADKGQIEEARRELVRRGGRADPGTVGGIQKPLRPRQP